VFWLVHADASAASMGAGALGVRKMMESAQNRLSGEGNRRRLGRAPSKVASNAPKEGFWSLAQARVVISDWKHDYNHHRRHSALGYQPPTRYAAGCTHRRAIPSRL
jgi:transposase InsO family protein